MSCKQSTLDGKLIITQNPSGLAGNHALTGESWRYLTGANIAMVDPDDPSSIQILTKEFYSACSPDISWTGDKMLFSAQEKKGDPWQIWEMDLKKLSSRKITSSEENAADPAFLPIDRVVFSKQVNDHPEFSGHALFTCNSDGSVVKQISLHPHTNFATTVLKDGRLLVITRQLYPETTGPMLMVIRPDGTKADLFYKGDTGTALLGRARETSDGMICFIESDSAQGGRGNVICIRYSNPMVGRINLTRDIPGNFNAVFPAKSGKMYVSYQKNALEPYALYEFDKSAGKLGAPVFQAAKGSIADVVMIDIHNRPRKLPSEVDPGVKTGQIMCQDINFSGLGIQDETTEKADRIEILGIDSTLGIVKVEEDGSFYLKVSANMPFRIQTLDRNNRVIRGPGAWLWLMPNERRGCIGCHEDRNLAPENNVPLAVKKMPVNVPVETEFIEKKVELE